MLNSDHIQPGTAWRDLIQTDTTPVTQVPLIVLKGLQEGPTLLVTAGIHGAEYASIEAAYRLAQIDPETLRGTLTVLPIVNQPSFAARSIYINPIDKKNLNRVFPGRVDGTFADQLAFWLTQTFIAHADIYVDLHGGDLNEALTPFVIYAEGDSEAERFAHLFGIQNVIASPSLGSTYSAGNSLGIPSILAEAGGQGQFSENDIALLTSGVQRIMRSQEMLPGAAEPVETTSYQEFRWLRAHYTGLWYLEVAVGDIVSPNQCVGIIRDFHGEIVQKAVSPVEGRILFAVTSLAINDGDPLVGIGA